MTNPGQWCALYFCCLLAAGYGITAIYSGLSRIERFGFAACIGPGITGLILLALSFAGTKPSRAAILTIGILGALSTIAGFLIHKEKSPQLKFRRPPTWLKILAILVIAYGFLSVSYDAIVYPTFDWDAFSIWQLKAKVLALAPMNPLPPYFHDVSLRYSHLRYPLLVPMISAGMHTMTGDVADELGNTPYILLYFGLVAAFYGFTRRVASPITALCACALFATVPALLDMAVSGLAEMALTAFYGCSIICILRWQNENKISDAFFATLFTLCLAWTKDEGSMLALINFLVMLLLTPRPMRKKNLLAAATLALTIILLFRLPALLFLPGPEYAAFEYPALMTPARILSNLNRLGPIVVAMSREFVVWHRWGLFWLVLLAIALLDIKRVFNRPQLTVWALFLLHLFAYIPPYLVTPLELPTLFPVTLPRLYPHLLPAAALLVALHGRNLISKNELVDQATQKQPDQK